jgi:hypothetical protein
MLQIHVLTGKQAGTVRLARRFPFGIGRASAADLCLDDEGVWDRHLVLDLTPGNRVSLAVPTEAVASVNSEPFRQVGWRNGDCVDVGGVKLQIWLGDIQRRSLRPREVAVWTALAVLLVLQGALVHWLGK